MAVIALLLLGLQAAAKPPLVDVPEPPTLDLNLDQWHAPSRADLEARAAALTVDCAGYDGCAERVRAASINDFIAVGPCQELGSRPIPTASALTCRPRCRAG